MSYCVHCEKEKSNTLEFASNGLGKYNICTDCLNGSSHDWFRHMMAKGRIKETDPNEPYWKKCEKELEAFA